jgi:hypothetical protein
MPRGPSPRGADKVFKPLIKGPGRVKPKNAALRDEGGDCGDERDVVRGVAGERREGRGGEHRVPGMVNKDTVQPNESRDRPSVGPGIATIRQRELNQAEGINGVVRESCFVEGEVVVVTVCRVTSEIEVPDNDPGSVIVRLVGGKRFQKRYFRAPLTWGIHIRETEDRRVIIQSEIQREDVAGGELVT